MVYVNSFRAIFFLTIQLVLAGFILFAAYLWVQNLESKGASDVREEVANRDCNCLSIISDNGSEIVLMNVRCNYVANLTINGILVLDVLYAENYVRYNYSQPVREFFFSYNNCTDRYIK